MRRLTLVVVVLALIVAPLFGFKSYVLYSLTLWAVTAIAAIGLNLTPGYAGQISLAQGAFVGVGAYASALLTLAGAPLPVGIVAAFLPCLALGWGLGYPVLRVKTHYLAFVTLAFNTLAYLVFRNKDWLTGGTYGLSNIPRPSLPGVGFERPGPFYWLRLFVLGGVTLLMAGLVRSPWGRAFSALRENPVRAESLGVDVR